VIQGRNGSLIATQGQGDTALNVALAKVGPGEFERVANQIGQSSQPIQVAVAQSEQPECGRTI
jgi:hypothetical protein